MPRIWELVDFYRQLLEQDKKTVIEEDEVLDEIISLRDRERVTDSLTFPDPDPNPTETVTLGDNISVTEQDPAGVVGISKVGFCEAG